MKIAHIKGHVRIAGEALVATLHRVLAVFGLAVLLFVAVYGTESWPHAAVSSTPIGFGAWGGSEITDPGPSIESASARQGLESRRQQALATYLSRRYRVSAVATQDLVGAAFRAAELTNLDPLLILAVAAVESGFNPIAESAYGATGLMQVVPRYHEERLAFHGGPETVLDPQTNIRVGAEILSDYIRRTGSLEAGLQMYAGAAGDSAGQYAQKVLAEKRLLGQAAKTPAPVAGQPLKPGA
jgi:soluble lytic murein transglycosylase-like protein